MELKIERPFDEMGYGEGYEHEDIDIISRLCFKIFDIQRAQQLEYHLAHLLDKPFEALFGFIHVLPGAFSGYSMQALQGGSILEGYFKSLQDKLETKKF